MNKTTTWYNKLQFVSMLLVVVGIAIDWRVGLWTTMAFGTVSILCMFAQGRPGNRSLAVPLRWGLIAIIAYWLLLLASMLYTSDSATGWTLLWLKAVILIFPLAFLLTDTGYLDAGHLRIVGYTLVASMLAMFFYYCGVGVHKLIDGETLAEVTGMHFDPRHHAYTALYLDVALLFIYYELYTRWNTMPHWLRTALLVAVPLLILYVIMVNSRAGIIVMYVAEVFAVVHFAVTRRRWWQAALLAVLLAGFTIGMESALPGHANRLGETLDDLPADGRMNIYKADLDAALQSPVFGYGGGDYRQVLVDQYGINGYEGYGDRAYNSHNQYFETLLSIGAVGLLVLLLWLAWPMFQAWRLLRKGAFSGPMFWLILMLTFTVAANFLFESMLERQMGLQFIGALMAVMALAINVEQNKFCQKDKK